MITLQQPISRIEKQRQNLQDDLESEVRLDILRWLSPMPFLQYHLEARKDVLVGTGNRFPNDDRFLEWRDQARRLSCGYTVLLDPEKPS